MPGDRSLTNEDRAFGREALGRGLVTRDDLAECTDIMAEDAAMGHARRSLAALLVERGCLSQEEAEELLVVARERAVPKRGSTRFRAVKPPPEVSRPKVTPTLTPRAPQAASGIDAADEGPPDVGRDAEIRKIVGKIAPGRIYLEMLEYVVAHDVSVTDIDALAAGIGYPRTQVVKALNRWVKAGIMQSVGDFPYCYSPIPRRQRDIKMLLDAWRNPRTRTSVLSYALERE